MAGVENATKDHTLVRKSTVLTGNSGDWVNSAGTDFSDSEWIVLDNETWDNLGFHIYDSTPLEIFGCTDPLYMEYNPNANIDDGSCVTLIMPITGCYWCDLARISIIQ